MMIHRVGVLLAGLMIPALIQPAQAAEAPDEGQEAAPMQFKRKGRKASCTNKAARKDLPYTKAPRDCRVRKPKPAGASCQYSANCASGWCVGSSASKMKCSPATTSTATCKSKMGSTWGASLGATYCHDSKGTVTPICLPSPATSAKSGYGGDCFSNDNCNSGVCVRDLTSPSGKCAMKLGTQSSCPSGSVTFTHNAKDPTVYCAKKAYCAK